MGKWFLHFFEEGELEENAVVRKFRTAAADGKKYNTTHYNFDVIISLGYRVKSKIATNFRRWATERLKEYMMICSTKILGLSTKPYQLKS